MVGAGLQGGQAVLLQQQLAAELEGREGAGGLEQVEELVPGPLQTVQRTVAHGLGPAHREEQRGLLLALSEERAPHQREQLGPRGRGGLQGQSVAVGQGVGRGGEQRVQQAGLAEERGRSGEADKRPGELGAQQEAEAEEADGLALVHEDHQRGEAGRRIDVERPGVLALARRAARHARPQPAHWRQR